MRPILKNQCVSVKVIAEAGVNHNGDMAMAIALVDAAADAGADIVKFQTFKAGNIASATAPKARYQVGATEQRETQLEMLKRLELTPEHHFKIREHCELRKIAFLSTPFDMESLGFLVDKMDVSHIKIASGEITNGPLLLAAARTGKPVLLSTGMCLLGEIEEALMLLAWGMSHPTGYPSRQSVRKSFLDDHVWFELRERVTLLHCTTEYPTPTAEVNLRAIQSLSNAFGLLVGFSDHSEGIVMPIAAVAMGACMVEKHFTLDRSLPGPDHKASLEPPELAAMVNGIRSVEAGLGLGVKRPTSSEEANRTIARKSLVAARSIPGGAVLQESDLTTKRPGTGVSPMRVWEFIGQAAMRAYSPDEMLDGSP